MRTPIRWFVVFGISLLFCSAWLPAAKAQEADMAVTKTADADQAPAGSNITYTITVFNNGPDSADNATLKDTLPAGTTFVSLSSPTGWSCSTPAVGSGGTITCTYPSLPVTSGDIFTLVVNIPSGTSPGTTFTNQATVSTTTFDPTDENDTASAATTVPSTSADMQVTKVASASEAFANSDITYTIQVTNFGPDVADNAELFDSLPGDMTFVSLSSPAGWACTTPGIGAGGSIVCTNPSFAAGAGATFTLIGHIPSGTSAGTTYNNTALASSSTSDPDSSNNNAITSTVVVSCFTNSVVTSNADSGPGSLRQAIADTCTGGTVIFDDSQVVSPITLTTAELLINKNLAITGPGANVMTVMRSAAGGTPNFRIFEIASGANVTISGLTVSNGAPLPGFAGSGGGFLNSGSLAFDGMVISGNNTGSPTQAGNGGGVFNFGTLTISNTTISGNKANTGGGLQSNSGTVKIINSTISGNTAIGFAGGIEFQVGSLTITNSTITNNRSDSDNSGGETGGGIDRASGAGPALLNNTIVAGNFRGTGTTRDDLSGSFSATSSYNLIGDGTGMTGITNGTNGNQVGTSAVPINALLAALGNYGGPTPTHLLLPASPAIDAALDALAVDANNDPLTSDQRGNGYPRLIGQAVDIGSVEVNYAINTTAGTPQSTAVNTAFPIALKATVTESGNPISGISVTFTAPASGASGTFSSGNTATVSTDANGVATAPAFTANGSPGTYTVVASVIGIATPANFSLTNVVGATTHFSVSAPANAIAGSAFNFTVTALDSGNNVVTAYSGTVHFTSTDAQAGLPADSTLTNGTGTFSATLKTTGNQTITATDTSTSATGTSNTISVNAAAATHFSVSAPANAVAGSAFNFTVTALDQFNNTATGYAGTVHFTSTDPSATLPTNSTLTNGTGTFSATLKTAGNRTITATDTTTSTITGTSNTITVTAGAATHFSVSAPASAVAGTAFNFTVMALDQFNNTATSYAGTVQFTSTDPNATLPTNTTLTNGTGIFSATLKTVGNRTITATDTTTSSITGTSNTITVTAGAATHFAVSAPASAVAGSAFNFTITALDQFNNTATSYAGTVQFTSTDPNATLPPNTTLTNGTGTFGATLKTVGNRTITATDTTTSSITGTSNTITVTAAAATHFSVSAPANAVAGNTFNFTVTALDQFNNTTTGYAGTVHFTSTDPNATLPANSTLTNGTGTFSATLRTVGNRTITATDTSNSAINGTSNSIAVSQATPTLSGTVSPTSGNVGTAFTDTAVLSGGVNPTGTITFTVHGPNAGNCATAIFTSIKTVAGNGSYTSDPFTATTPGTYTFVAQYSGDANNSPVGTVCGAAGQTFTVNQPSPSPTPTATPTPAQSLNISTRARTELGDRAMIGGFIITGNAPKPVVIRGLGPSLSTFGLSDLLLNPQLELRGSSNNLIFLNRDWKDNQRSLIEGTNFEPKDERESVIVISLNPGAYTAILTGEGGTTGIGLVEVYDTNPGVDSKLGNISTRGFVQTGDKVMIGGFTLGVTNNPTRIAVRGRGPSLSQFNLSPVLADPTLELRNQNGTIMIVNDDWQSDPVSAKALTDNGLGLSDPKEAGIFALLPAGQFTAILAGSGGGTGIGLIEIYNLQ
jgi:uncharacterized repeat protein (TIGR01451 family)